MSVGTFRKSWVYYQPRRPAFPPAAPVVESIPPGPQRSPAVRDTTDVQWLQRTQAYDPALLVPPSVPALVACTGFEYGTHAGLGGGVFDGVTGTLGTDVQVIAGAAQSGGYGLEVALTAKGPFWTTTTLGTGKTALVVAMRFRLTTLPSGNTDIISMDVAAGSDRAGFFYNSATGKLHAWIAASNQASAATISANTWYTLEWVLDVTGTNTLDWKLDGVAGAQVSASTASTIARLQLGNRSAGTGVAQYDNVVVSSTGTDYPLGNHTVQLLTVDPADTVTSNSTTNFRRFTSNGTIDGAWNATDVRDAVDEVPPTIGASADGAVQVSNNSTGYMEFPMTSYTLAGGETVAGVRMVACGWAADTTPATIEIRSYNGTTETTLYALADPGFDASTTAPTWVCRMLTLADVDTQGELDALAFRVGFSTDAAPDVGVHAIYAEVAVKAAAAAADVPWSPQRSIPASDPGEAWWLQRGRLDATLVVTAADPLPSPLDAAYGVGGRYWHLYNDWRDRRATVQQRAYVSDPSLLATTPDEIPYSPARTVQTRDPEAQGAQRRTFDATLLETTFDPPAGGTLWQAYNLAALHVDRRAAPAQPPRESAPGMLDTAELENELLGGAETGKRTNVPATHADRREVPQQRQVYADTATPGVPYDLSVNPGWQAYILATLHADRREVPQQRPYVSDPSFYPTQDPTDPLTLAWGAGGTYWLLYNTAALQVTRRLIPQQPQRETDPNLLATALLESELLGGADTSRHGHAAVYTDRREVPQQRRYQPDPGLLATALLEGALLAGARPANLAAYVDRRTTTLPRPVFDPSLLGVADVDPTTLAAGVGGDLWRHANAAAYYDRRQVAAQPPRVTLYFDAGPDVPPLTLAWGVGGNLWHLYNPRRPTRSWWPTSQVFAVECSCITLRPSTGTTARGSTGITTRPDTGVTEDPCC